jgi:pyruvate/2-oxoglutarate dehydrogenase complex dihydrolipoamide acyltransferase (E2) component
VTSLGDQGVETVFGIVYPPQVAIVGFGRVVERPWAVAGQVVARPVVTATLAADHRVTDGHRGGGSMPPDDPNRRPWTPPPKISPLDAGDVDLDYE